MNDEWVSGHTSIGPDAMRMPSRRTNVNLVAETANASANTAASVDAFRRILRELRVAARKTELATGLSAAQLFVLSAIAEAPGCSVNQIADATMTDRSSAAAIVDRLVDQGYVTREQSGEDRRRAAIEITARGRRAKKSAAPAPTTLLIAGLTRLKAPQLQGLTDGLIALTRSMGIADEPPGMLFEDARPKRRSKKA